MNMDNRYALLRNKLDTLGFVQPLPIGALSIVSAILDDLILTTNSLKRAKEEIAQLQEEKTAWDLGTEPLKCDNSKLLAECNSLHTDIMRQRDEFQAKLYELSKTIRNLQVDKRYLEEHCNKLNQKVHELQHNDANKKSKDQINNNRKPFISTVRSGSFFSVLKDADSDSGPTQSCWRCCPSTSRGKLARLEAEREKNHAKDMMDLAELYKKQLDSRDREIGRLNSLLVGGRPSSALAKDCCYRGVGTLTEDMQELQKEKSKLQQQLEACLRKQHDAMERAIALDERNRKLANELNDIEQVALSVESEANSSLSTLHKQNFKLKVKVNEQKQYIDQLEDQLNAMEERQTDASDVARLRAAYKEAKLEVKKLQTNLEALNRKDDDWRNEKDKLLKKYAKVKGRLSVLEKAPASTVTAATQATNEISQPPDYLHRSSMENDIARMKADRDYYQKEYLRLVSQKKNDAETEVLRTQLIEKQYENNMLRQQLATNAQTTDPLSARSVQSAMNRSEREIELLRQNLKTIKEERDNLRDQLRRKTDSKNDQQEQYDDQINGLKSRIVQLESENRNLQSVQGPSKSTISLLRDENNQMKAEIRTLSQEISKLKTSNSQLRMIQEQTENALAEHQSRLSHSEAQLVHAESRLGMVDSSRSQVCHEIGELKADIVILRTNNTNLLKEKEKLSHELEKKTEKIFQLESRIDELKNSQMELESQILMTNRQLEEANAVKKQKEGSLQQVTGETEALRNQMQKLRRAHENAMAENSRLTRELTDLECEQCLTKTKLTEAEKEVSRTKNQLQQYMQEVERVEELLLRKEEEREEMLNHYRSLSQGAVILEDTNHSLEAEAAETKRNLVDVESKVSDMRSQLIARDKELAATKAELKELSRHLSSLESEHSQCTHEKSAARKELIALKELCEKLDNEKDKLNAEVTEYADVRRELERENEKLRNEMLLNKSGDKVAVESLQQMLTTCRDDLEQQRMMANQANKEVTKLRARVEELQDRLSDEHSNAIRNETLAKEYSLQIQELRNHLTDDRFLQVCSKDKDESIDRFSSL